MKCAKCGGDGKVKQKQSRSTGAGAFRETQAVQRGCEVCNARGTTACEHCKPLWGCTRCHRFWTSEIAYCPDCHPKDDPKCVRAPSTITKLTGEVVCKKCDGKGEYEKTGTCPKCKRGRMPCPECCK